jgi:hypothetical protein
LGSEPPKFGRIAGALPVVLRIESAVQFTQGLSTSVREAPKRCAPLTSTIGKPLLCRYVRTASMTSSYLVPTTKRSCSTALAWPGMALAGFSILPEDIASTSSVFHANSRSAGVRPSSPQSSASCGSSAVGSILTSASAARTALEIRGGLRASSFIRPLPSTRLAMALHRIVAGLASTPPQLPE